MNQEPQTDESELALVNGEGCHGEAALLLVESLIHELVASDIISVSAAVEVVDIAVDARVEKVFDQCGTMPAVLGPVALLEAIGASLQHDLPDDS